MRHLFLTFSFSLLVISSFQFALASDSRTHMIAEINPRVINLGIYHSYQHKLAVIAFNQSSPQLFDCLPNRYVFFKYDRNDYHEILAGNLKLSSDFSRILRLKVHSFSDADAASIKLNQKFLSILNISVETMNAGRTKSKRRNLSCWQQPELLKSDGTKIRSYPLLAANLCDSLWCSELYWTGSDKVQLWIQQTPAEYHLISLNVNDGSLELKKRGPKFQRDHLDQPSAPRQNLFSRDKFSKGSVKLTSQIRLEWESQSREQVKIWLSRSDKTSVDINARLDKIEALFSSGDISTAFQQIDFTIWLAPENMDLKYRRLKAYMSLKMTDKFFGSIQKDFSSDDRIAICQKLHIDQDLRKQWLIADLAERFKSVCVE